MLTSFGDSSHRRTFTTSTTYFGDQISTRDRIGGFEQLVTAKTSSRALLQTEVSILRIYDGNTRPTRSQGQWAVSYDFVTTAATEGKTTTQRLVSSPQLYERFSALRNSSKRTRDYNGSQWQNNGAAVIIAAASGENYFNGAAAAAIGDNY